MPSTSDKQKKFMAAAAHNPEFAKKAGVPVSVAKEFNKADTIGREDLQKVNKPKTDHGQQSLFKKGGNVMKKEARMEPAKMEKVKPMSAKAGGKDAAMKPAKMEKVKKMSFAKGGGIESKGKTKGKIC